MQDAEQKRMDIQEMQGKLSQLGAAVRALDQSEQCMQSSFLAACMPLVAIHSSQERTVNDSHQIIGAHTGVRFMVFCNLK